MDLLPNLQKMSRNEMAARVASDIPGVVAEHDAGAKTVLIPAAVLRDSVNVALARAVEHVDPLYQLPERELVSRVADRVGRDAAAVVARLAPRLRALPTRVHAAAPWTRGRLSERHLTDLYDDAAGLYRHLGEPPLDARAPEA